MTKSEHPEQVNRVEQASTKTKRQNPSNKLGAPFEADVKYADTATIIENLKGAIAGHAFTFGVFSKQGQIEYRFGYGSKPQEFLIAAEALCAEGYDLWGGAVSPDRRNWRPFVFRGCRSSCSEAFIIDQLDRAVASTH
jgi:hypothetical protein